jgi:hypothetical protein
LATDTTRRRLDNTNVCWAGGGIALDSVRFALLGRGQRGCRSGASGRLAASLDGMATGQIVVGTRSRFLAEPHSRAREVGGHLLPFCLALPLSARMRLRLNRDIGV